MSMITKTKQMTEEKIKSLCYTKEEVDAMIEAAVAVYINGVNDGDCYNVVGVALSGEDGGSVR